nr:MULTISPECIES: sigma-70 family RNA polymerase sigma factor [Motilibacter]
MYAACAPRLVRAVYAVTGDMNEAQDVVNEAFMRAWAARRSLGRVDQPEAWLRTVAVRLAVSRWRRTRTAAAAWLRKDIAEAVPEVSPDSVALVAALRQLPDTQRVAVVLHYFYDLPLARIATETNSSLSAVKSRLSRARTTLAVLLADPAPQEPSRA